MCDKNYTEAVDGILIPNPKIDDIARDDKIKVNRGKVDSINIYEVSESELSVIESGAPSSLYLNFFTFFCGIFLSFLSVLLTVKLNLQAPQELIVFVIFMLIEMVSFCFSFVMIIIWLVKRKDLSNIIKRIRKRIK